MLNPNHKLARVVVFTGLLAAILYGLARHPVAVIGAWMSLVPTDRGDNAFIVGVTGAGGLFFGVILLIQWVTGGRRPRPAATHAERVADFADGRQGGCGLLGIVAGMVLAGVLILVAFRS